MKLSPEYINTSEQTSETCTEKQDQLVILDLNGTLCSRTRGRNRNSYYLRPHAKRFFDYIFTNYTVMAWSSAQEQSVEKMCNMFLPYKPGLIWNRSHFNLTEDEFYRNSETLKDLNMVWEISDDFNAKNTIIMDDTSTKVSSQPYNLMLMSTFEHSTNADSFAEDDLLKAIAYLKKLRYQTNVANYMKNHPFDVSFDYEIEKVNPCERSYIGHYVKGVWVNPPSALPLSEKVEKKQKTKKGLAEDSEVPSIDDVKQTAQEKRKEKRKEKKRRKMLLRKAKEAEDAK